MESLLIESSRRESSRRESNLRESRRIESRYAESGRVHPHSMLSYAQRRESEEKSFLTYPLMALLKAIIRSWAACSETRLACRAESLAEVIFMILINFSGWSK